jgi:hypothetical protein
MALTTGQVAALASEINNDPAVLGYAPPKAAGNDQGVADLLNAVGSTPAFQVNREPISVALFVENIDPTEFSALTQLQVSRLSALFAGGTLNINGTRTQQNLLNIFPAAGATKTNVSALLKRFGSRAEVLFGNGVVITANDVSKALRGL